MLTSSPALFMSTICLPNGTACWGKVMASVRLQMGGGGSPYCMSVSRNIIVTDPYA